MADGFGDVVGGGCLMVMSPVIVEILSLVRLTGSGICLFLT